MNKRWTWIVLAIVVLGAAFYFRTGLLQLIGVQQSDTNATAQAQGEGGGETGPSTITIRPATDVNQVSAAGNIETSNPYSAVIQIDGIVTEVLVEVGDNVAKDDLIAILDTSSLERAVQRAELEVDTQQNLLDQLLEPAEPADIAASRANLASAKEALADTQAGASDAELAAAEAALTAAQESYQEVLNGSSDAELIQASVELNKAAITLKNAQEAYDRIAYRGDIGSTQQAIDLQNATIDYEATKAAYEIATEPASQADIQEALKAIKDAESQLDSLRNQPTQADIAAAEAQVASAEAELANLLTGPTESELREAELALEQSQLDLEEAEADLAQARLRAPIDGTILTMDVEVGQKLTSGASVASVADLTELELTVNVAEVDIRKMREGQIAQITIDALPDQIFSGLVTRIAPASDSTEGVVNYPVTIQLDNLNLDEVRAGMTAVATISDEAAGSSWLVPTDALQEFEGETTVRVIRDGQPTRVAVEPGTSQGEWTVVQSAELEAGDKVVGNVSTFLDENNGFGGPRGFGPPPR